MKRTKFLLLCLLLGVDGSAPGQILPPVQLPTVPGLPTDELNRTVGALQRLCATCQIDDRQAAMAERRELISIDAIAVGTSMPERIEHAAHRRFARCAIGREKGCEAVHDR